MDLNVVLDQGRQLAQSRHQPLDTVHLIEVLLDSPLLPVPESQQALARHLLTTLADLRGYTRHDPFDPTSPPETLYVHVALQGSNDLPHLLYNLFWSPWQQTDSVIRLFHQMQWAPEARDLENWMATSLDMPPVPLQSRSTLSPDPEFIPESLRRDRKFWPVNLSPIMRGARIDAYQYFLCTHLLLFPDHVLVSALATGTVPTFLLGDSGEDFLIEAQYGGSIDKWTPYDAGGLTLCRDYRFKGKPFLWKDDVTLHLIIHRADHTTQRLLLTAEVLNEF
ncbi:MAG: hypothetical protein C7B43_21540 [Sulfobacillus benefaciens]|jgi:hypothetical protein|uniref:Uncharacterized protein n=1 Tax=Sulfobacillus benefaciens TaxID=453960 RepID=A0A2T2WFS0_9FIRM|nr:MAG: hypothetical protein C7B43_21540 [Sulfobacillus benefaciens]